MAKSYVRLDKNNAAVLLVDHQAGLLSLVRRERMWSLGYLTVKSAIALQSGSSLDLCRSSQRWR